MIGYQLVGTNQYEEAFTFYDALLNELGAKMLREEENVFAVWSAGGNSPSFGVCRPLNGKAAVAGNGAMTAFNAECPEDVNRLYAKAMELGASDEGAPGSRAGGTYAAYCRDLDGNKFSFFCMTAPTT